MCLEHASAIDDGRTVDRYPATVLLEWKRLQTEEYRRRMEGWPLTTAMAEEAIAASFANVGIAINQSNVELGGQGGHGAGAGGGGGGAIGPNSRGGKGGDGGRHHDLDAHPLLSANDEASLFSLSEKLLRSADPSTGISSWSRRGRPGRCRRWRDWRRRRQRRPQRLGRPGK